MKKTAIIFLTLLLLTGCSGRRGTQVHAPATTQPAAEETVDPRVGVEHLEVVLQAGEVYTLKGYPDLKSADLTGSTCYQAILDYAATDPDLDITYTVDLGGMSLSNKETTATLPAGSFSYELLAENLAFLPRLTSLSLPQIALSAEQVAFLRETYPHISLHYTVELLGQSLDASVTELDLSAMESASVEEVAGKLGLLQNLATVQLGDHLSLEEVAKLQDACPGAFFQYQFSLFGKNLTTADTQVVFKDHTIGAENEPRLRQALAVLDNCTRFVLDNCGLDNETLAKLREDFRNGPKVVWRVWYGVGNRYTNLTDDEMLRAVYNVTDGTCGPMKYCEDVKYMDIGHNETLTDLSFIGYMPNIEVVIASGSAVTELVGFENCKKLTWLELAYCYDLENIDALAGCESLRFLNLSYTHVTNLMSLDGLPLERFMCLSPKASDSERSTFQQIHPDCLTVFSGQKNPYGYGWRYDDNGYTFSEYYKNVVRKAFNYDYLESLL